MTKNIFYGYYDKEYFKNNIKITILLKRAQIKNNFETTITNCNFKKNCKTTITNCDFKDIFKTFKTTITNGGFLHLKKKIMWMLTCIQKISLTNILR